MVKHFHIIMAAFISGTVALFTSVLGVSGTIIGSVLSSFLYQLLSGYSEEKLEEGGLRKPKLANEIVYIFPLVVIGIFELIFFMSAIHYSFDMLFDMLEAAVNNNLFRLMGLGLIFLGAYPFFDSNNIDRRNGTVVILIGILLLLRGLVDITDLSYRIFYTFFAQFDSLFAIFVVIGLALVILNILIGSGNLKESTTNLMGTHKPKLTGARKIDTSFIEEDSSNQGNGHNEHIESNLRDNSQNNDYLDDSENHYQDTHVENHYQDAHADNQENQEQLPLYEEEIILVNNPEDPENPIKKRILKRVKRDSDLEDDDYEDMYILDEVE